ncbi:MAG: purine-nucleoside phosphorylase [Thermodesulfobacteriota bacterium]|nr:purine-nucleoside phosphorylase [Thermodesulfobacteriota bacterium]
MESFENKVREATDFVRSRIDDQPKIGLIMGTGLGDGADSIKGPQPIDYGDVPGFPLSTVPSHRGRFISGHMQGKPVLAMQGRFHYYEGYSAQEVTFPIRVMQLLGVKTLILSNAAGGINPLFDAGDIMVITDHINLTGGNPLVGPNVDAWGPRFPDMTQVYDRTLMVMAETAALENNVRIQKGVYVGLAGPSLETRAEIRFLKTIGADAVGLSTIFEVIAAVHAGMAILGLSVITNMNLPDNPNPCQVEEIIATAEKAAPRLQAIIDGVIGQLPAHTA